MPKITLYQRYANGGEHPFTADEIKANHHALYQDWKCPRCGWEAALSNVGSTSGPCRDCGWHSGNRELEEPTDAPE